jgi:hypothetical protein
VAAAVGAAGCGGTASGRSISPTSSQVPAKIQSRANPTDTPETSGTGPLAAPTTSALQDGQFLSEVTEADPALAAYEQNDGNVALRALLTDGSAFCALLKRGGGVDDSMVAVAVGARGDESQTRLPLSVTTFNAIEAVALLTLCPTYQSLLPAPDQAKIDRLGAALGTRSG